MERSALLTGCFRSQTLLFELLFARKCCGEFLFLASSSFLGLAGELFLAEPFPFSLPCLSSFLNGSPFSSQGHHTGVVGTRS